MKKKKIEKKSEKNKALEIIPNKKLSEDQVDIVQNLLAYADENHLRITQIIFG